MNSLWEPKPKDAVDPQQIRRVLVIKLRHLGDVLLTGPVFDTLRANLPSVEVDALVYSDTAVMLQGHPAVDQIHIIDRRWKTLGPVQQFRHEWALFKTLKARQYDLVVHLTEHNRGMWLSRFLKPRWSVAPEKLAKNSSGAKKVFTHFYANPRGANAARRHQVELNLDALRRLGFWTPAERLLRYAPSLSSQHSVESFVAANPELQKPFAVMHPGSRWSFKCLSVEQYALLAHELVQRGLSVAITASPDPQEKQLVEAILQHPLLQDPAVRQQILPLVNVFPIPEFAALLQRAACFVGVDSMPMHMAAAANIPLLAFFGPSGDQEWAPWSDKAVVVTSRFHPCRPCGNDGCGGGKVSECLTTLSRRYITEALDAMLLKGGA